MPKRKYKHNYCTCCRDPKPIIQKVELFGANKKWYVTLCEICTKMMIKHALDLTCEGAPIEQLLHALTRFNPFTGKKER